MPFHRILCPVDFSSLSDQVIRVGARLAKRDRAELVITHVWYAGEYTLGSLQFPADTLERLLSNEQRFLDAAMRNARSLGAERVTIDLLRGSPSQQIIEKLRTEPTFDLVVMGSRGRTGLSRVLLGSVAEKVVRHAPCPVLVTRDAIEAAPFHRILCPIDFTPGSQFAIEQAVKALEPGSEVTLLHVLDVPSSYAQEPSLRTFEEVLDREAKALLTKAADELRSNRKVSVTTRLVVGHPGAEILKVLDADPAFDLVVVGSRGRTGLKRAVLGSVAEKVVRHAPCPVLVAHQREVNSSRHEADQRLS